MTRPRQTTKKRTDKHKSRDPNKLEPTQVAHIMGITYQRARNMMLLGAFGTADYSETTRKLTVQKTAVLAAKSRPRSTARARAPESPE